MFFNKLFVYARACTSWIYEGFNIEPLEWVLDCDYGFYIHLIFPVVRTKHGFVFRWCRYQRASGSIAWFSFLISCSSTSSLLSFLTHVWVSFTAVSIFDPIFVVPSMVSTMWLILVLLCWWVHFLDNWQFFVDNHMKFLVLLHHICHTVHCPWLVNRNAYSQVNLKTQCLRHFSFLFFCHFCCYSLYCPFSNHLFPLILRR